MERKGGKGALAEAAGRRQRKGRGKRAGKAGFELAHPDCAGIDVGSGSWVCEKTGRSMIPLMILRGWS
jgi:hypothetical protein